MSPTDLTETFGLLEAMFTGKFPKQPKTDKKNFEHIQENIS